MSDRRTGADRRPSAAARARVADGLHRELGSSRLAWDAALLRSDAAIAGGDEDEVRAALDDHRLLLAILEQRIGEVVATADTGETLDPPARTAVGDLEPTLDAEPAGVCGPAAAGRDRLATALQRAGVLLGAAAAVLAVIAVGVGDPPTGARTTIAGSAQDAAVVDAELEARRAGETRPRPIGPTAPRLVVPERTTVPLDAPTAMADALGEDAAPPAPDLQASDRSGAVPPIPAPPTVDPADAADEDDPPRIADLFERLSRGEDSLEQDTSTSLPGAFRDLLAP